MTFAKTDEARQLIQMGIHDVNAITRAMPSPVPQERVQILRQAFQDTLKDAEFLAEAEKARLGFDPVSGEAMAEIVASFFKRDPGLVAKLKETLARN